MKTPKGWTGKQVQNVLAWDSKLTFRLCPSSENLRPQVFGDWFFLLCCRILRWIFKIYFHEASKNIMNPFILLHELNWKGVRCSQATLNTLYELYMYIKYTVYPLFARQLLKLPFYWISGSYTERWKISSWGRTSMFEFFQFWSCKNIYILYSVHSVLRFYVSL